MQLLENTLQGCDFAIYVHNLESFATDMIGAMRVIDAINGMAGLHLVGTAVSSHYFLICFDLFLLITFFDLICVDLFFSFFDMS